MRYFECLTASVNNYTLRIVEEIPEIGFVLITKQKDSFGYIPPVAGSTIQFCKEEAKKEYGVPIDAWREEGDYFESLIARNEHGDTFRIKGDLPEVGFYLHAFDKKKNPIDEDLKGYSDLQDTAQACKKVALKVFDVPLDAWQEEGEVDLEKI